VPIDDTHCWIFGLRHFSGELEAKGIGNKALVGKNSLDIYAQTGDRSYDEMQRNPGDWEVEVSLRPIAIHALENRGTTDKGVVQLRRQLPRATERLVESPGAVEGIVPIYTSNTVLRVPMRNSVDDRELLRQVGRAIVDAVVSGNGLSGAARRRYITTQPQAVQSSLAVQRSKL
jgi:hypothetical protein